MILPATTTELHREVLRALSESRATLDRALLTAWHIGRLLQVDQARARRLLMLGEWRRSVAANLRCTERTIDRYLKLAAAATDPGDLPRLSFRQAYYRLGVSTQPKARAKSLRLPILPRHLRSAQRVLLSVRTQLRGRQMTDEQHRHLCDDLRPLHQQLCVLFATDSRRSAAGARFL